MNILNDTEHRLFLSAMQREKKVCEQFDNSGDSGIKLLPICRSIERKVDKAVMPGKSLNYDAISGLINEIDETHFIGCNGEAHKKQVITVIKEYFGV